MPGAATQIFSAELDAALSRLPKNVATLIMGKIDDMGHRLESFPHYRMTGRNEFRLRVGDYRVIYDFNVAKNELYLTMPPPAVRSPGRPCRDLISELQTPKM